MPGLPDPNTNKKYRLQVGAFTDQNAAAHTYRSLQDAGFSPLYEHSQNYYRVVIADVPASSVASTVQRLVQAGINQIWVRE
jgi:cell division protein FtsN